MIVNNVKFRQLFIFSASFLSMFLLSRCLSSQIILEQSQSIPVEFNGSELTNAWAGGINAAQFSTIDVNNDGREDLYTFDRDGFQSMVFLNMSTTPGETDYRYSIEYL